MTETEVKTPGDEPPPSDHTGDQDYDSSDSEDESEPPDHSAPRKCHQRDTYIWVERYRTHWNRVYKTEYQADLFKDSVEEYP